MKKTSKGFFKNCPIGRNEILKCQTRIDTKRIKVTNHSNRAAAVTQLAKVGVSENQIMKVTGHSNLASIKSYLQINSEHHEKIIQKMRSNNSEITRSDGSSIETPSSTSSKVSYSSSIFTSNIPSACQIIDNLTCTRGSLLAKIQIFELFDWLKFFEGNSHAQDSSLFVAFQMVLRTI
jgi:hypothetical protein